MRGASPHARHLLFIAKNLERIGDHATNIAETVHYAVSRRGADGGTAERRWFRLCHRSPAQRGALDHDAGCHEADRAGRGGRGGAGHDAALQPGKQGFNVDEAVDGQEALTRISEAQPDIVLLDWMLPVMSGIEVCARYGGARRLAICPSSW